MIKRLEMLSILTGGTCNLQCSYCFLHKERKAKELDDEITLKLKNGEYALNCFKSINSIGADTLKIKELDYSSYSKESLEAVGRRTDLTYKRIY